MVVSTRWIPSVAYCGRASVQVALSEASSSRETNASHTSKLISPRDPSVYDIKTHVTVSQGRFIGSIVQHGPRGAGILAALVDNGTCQSAIFFLVEDRALSESIIAKLDLDNLRVASADGLCP
jgi:hypothetical protein